MRATGSTHFAPASWTAAALCRFLNRLIQWGLPSASVATNEKRRRAGAVEDAGASKHARGLGIAWLFAFCLSPFAFPLSAAPPSSIAKLPAADQRARIASDMRGVLLHRDGLKHAVTFACEHPDLFPDQRLSEGRVLRREDKEAIWNTWKAYLDYALALESTAAFHRDFYLLRRPAQDESTLVRCAAHFAQHRWALAFIARAENDPGLATLLNEPVPELGLPRGTYAQMKLRFLNPVHAAHFTALAAVLRTVGNDAAPAFRAVVREDEAEILRSALVGKTELLTAKNALQVLKQAGGSVWLPVQTGIAEWMGDTKVARLKSSLISQAQITALRPRLLPGDVLITRRNWYLSNIGLPGFWPHAAIYLGTPAERRASFGPALAVWLQAHGGAADLEAVLKSRYPAAHATSEQPYHGHAVRVLEAQSEGVSFTSLEHAAEADALVVLRPKLSPAEKATALVRAFHYAGRPYDFNFDFATDAELVCTELVYKAYEPATGFTGLKLPLVEVLGRKTLPANEIVRQFDAQFGTPEQQFEFIAFLDGDERSRKATDASLDAFRQTWKRAKWHVVSQALPKLK